MRAAVVLLFGLAACASGSGSTAFGSKPFSTVTSAACDASFDAYSAPDPLTRGDGEVEIVATSSQTGAPIDGLSVSMVAWMPAMGHGSSTTPVVTAQGNGKYVASGLVLAMPGDWQLRTTIGGACTDSIVFTVSVQ